MSLFQNKYRIESARLQSWDYGSNAPYFVTICTSERIHDFGNIINDQMHLSQLGIVADDCWNGIPQHFPFVELGEHVIMPNHIHGIIIINKPPHVKTQDFASPDNTDTKFTPQSKTLGSIIRGYKIGVTKYATQHNIQFRWQPRFHDHIIRDMQSFNQIRHYIMSNPQNWKDDRYNSVNLTK